jgi:hypothetical protein
MVAVFALAYLLTQGGGVVEQSPAGITSGVYVEDFRERPVPTDIREALGVLNSEHGIVATSCDVGEPVIPLSYAAPVDVAKKAGLPSFVFMAGSKVVEVLHKPTGKEVLEVMK